MTRPRFQFEVIPFFLATFSGFLLLMNIPARMSFYFGPGGSWCGGAWCVSYWETMINIGQIIAVNCVTFISWILLISASRLKYPITQSPSFKKLLWIRLVYLVPLITAFILLMPLFQVVTVSFYSDVHFQIFSLGVYLSLAYFAFILSANIMAWIPNYWLG